MKEIRKLFTNFRLRKRLLDLSDAFIVVIAGLLANFPIPIYAARIGRPELFAYPRTHRLVTDEGRDFYDS